MTAASSAPAFNSWAELMEYNHSAYREKPFLIYYDANGNRTQWSYAVFIETAQRLASLLRHNGIVRGNKVAIAGHNHPDTILGYFACWILGACAVPLNMSEDDARLEYILTNSETRLVLCRTEYLARINHPHVIEVDTDAGDPVFYSLLRDQPLFSLGRVESMLTDESLIVYTSGTTGNPKGVVLTQGNMFADSESIGRWHGITPETRMMCVLPVHHVNGTIVTHTTPFLMGASVVLCRKFSASRFWDIVIAENIHGVSVVPTLLAYLLEADAADSTTQLPESFHIICGAGPLTCELASRFERRFGFRIIHGYGLSETTCYTCFIPVHLSDEQHASWMRDHGFPSIGVALPCNEMAIHNDLGQPVAPGERGEIVARGSNIMKGYHNNKEANDHAFTYGWFRSGDEGFYLHDAEGTAYYFITGRLKELIIRGGVNIAPLEIDEVINRAPGVKAGIAVGFEHDMYGEEVGALVVPEENANADEIRQFCLQNLPLHKAPKVVLFATELPVTSTGKHQRNKVRHLFADYRCIRSK